VAQPTQHLLANPGPRNWLVSAIPLSRIGAPENLAEGAVFRASRCTTGQSIVVDGGWLAS
jgi:NAD(P)-dependent dehydrogenase (short-subunit alcohol dehydrogenase family)